MSVDETDDKGSEIATQTEAINRLAREVERLNGHRFMKLHGSRWRMLMFSLSRGLAFGLGSVLGAGYWFRCLAGGCRSSNSCLYRGNGRRSWSGKSRAPNSAGCGHDDAEFRYDVAKFDAGCGAIRGLPEC